MRLLIQLTETDKRIIFALFIVFILLFVIIGYLGLLITRIMKYQGKKLDSKVYDAVITRVVPTKKEFKSYAIKKNHQMFYKSAQIPIIILVLSGLAVLFHFLINGFNCNLFDPEHGFSTLLFLWDFKNTETVTWFGIKIWSNWPPLYETIGTPKFVWEGLPSYIGVFGLLTGGLWYLYEVQCLISRTLRIKKLCDSLFEKSLEGVNLNTQMMNEMQAGLVPQPTQAAAAPASEPQPQANNNQNTNLNI